MGEKFGKAPCAVALVQRQHLAPVLGAVTLQGSQADAHCLLQGVAPFQKAAPGQQVLQDVGREAIRQSLMRVDGGADPAVKGRLTAQKGHGLRHVPVRPSKVHRRPHAICR